MPQDKASRNKTIDLSIEESAEFITDDALYCYMGGAYLSYLFITPDGVTNDFSSERANRDLPVVAEDALKEMKVDGQHISSRFLRPEKQAALGEEGYDKGAEILYNFFEKELAVYDTEELHPIGKQILECFYNRGTIEDYCAITPLGLG